MQAQPRRSDDVAQEGLGQCGQQVFLVGVVPVEHRGRLTRRRCDVGQRGAVKAALGEQLPGGLLDGGTGLAAFGCERLDRHGYAPSSRSPARSNELGSSWPTRRSRNPGGGDRGVAVRHRREFRCPAAGRPDLRWRCCRFAPGANGHPPSPPTEASSRVTPAVTAAYALASPAPRVLWKCAPSGMSAISGENLGDQVGHAAWRRGADGVGDREPVGVAVARRLDDVEDPLQQASGRRRGSPMRWR